MLSLFNTPLAGVAGVLAGAEELSGLTPDAPATMGGLSPEQAASSPEGMFGISGTGRDILGTLGDAFLLQSGNDPIYAPKRQNEKFSEAMQGFVDNPLAAVQQLTDAGFGAQARQLYSEHVKDRREEAKAQQQIAESQQRTTNQRQTFEQSVHQNVAGMLSSAQGGNPERQQAVMEWARRYYDSMGVKPMGEIPENYDPNYANTINEALTKPIDRRRANDTEAYREEQLKDADERTAIQARNASTAERNAATGERRARDANMNNLLGRAIQANSTASRTQQQERRTRVQESREGRQEGATLSGTGNTLKQKIATAKIGDTFTIQGRPMIKTERGWVPAN